MGKSSQFGKTVANLVRRNGKKQLSARTTRRLAFECLEHREYLSGVTTNVEIAPAPDSTIAPDSTSRLDGFLTPAQIRQAYGINSLLGPGQDGTGQTIAIVVAWNDPHIVNDVVAFNNEFGLAIRDAWLRPGPTFTILDQNGNTIRTRPHLHPMGIHRTRRQVVGGMKFRSTWNGPTLSRHRPISSSTRPTVLMTPT